MLLVHFTFERCIFFYYYIPGIYHSTGGEESVESEEETQLQYMCHHALTTTCLGHAYGFKSSRIC